MDAADLFANSLPTRLLCATLFWAGLASADRPRRQTIEGLEGGVHYIIRARALGDLPPAVVC